MGHIEQLLLNMRRRPAIYIGKHCLRRLHFFLLGYDFGAAEIGGVAPDLFLANFRDWIMARFASTAQGWDELIISHSENEAAAFEQFWQLFDEFRAQQQTSNGVPVSGLVEQPRPVGK